MNAPELVFAMRKHCLEEAKKYAPERVMKTIKRKSDSVLSE